LNGVFQVNRTQGKEDADIPGTYFEMRKTVYPKIAACARTDFPSVQVLPTAAHCARQPRLLYGYKPSVQKTRFVKVQNHEHGLPKDRRLRADGLIIRAQAAIRTDRIFVRAAFANPCALRAPTSSRKQNVSPVNSP
jgi:hypothetical protein